MPPIRLKSLARRIQCFWRVTWRLGILAVNSGRRSRTLQRLVRFWPAVTGPTAKGIPNADACDGDMSLAKSADAVQIPRIVQSNQQMVASSRSGRPSVRPPVGQAARRSGRWWADPHVPTLRVQQARTSRPDRKTEHVINNQGIIDEAVRSHRHGPIIVLARREPAMLLPRPPTPQGFGAMRAGPTRAGRQLAAVKRA